VPLRAMRGEVKLFREENLPLLVDEAKLGLTYNKIIGAQTVEWDGEERTLAQLRALIQCAERATRERAWRLAAARQLADRDAINALWQQFMGLRRQVAANTGFGDDYSAAQQVEYANASTDTIGGSWRAKNGHPEPYNVKYWCVGNEMFGDWQLGFMRREHYSLKHNLVARAMRRVDPNLVLVGVGDLGDPTSRRSWSRGMLQDSRQYMDMISEHFYQGRTPWGGPPPEEVPKYVALLKNSIREKADGHRKLQAELGIKPDNIIPIAMDEWNYWHRDYVFGELGCHYDLADALGVAAGLHEYFRQSEIIPIANYAQTVNVIGCIKTTKTDAFLDTTALPLMLYRKHFGETPVAVSGDFGERELDVVAALDGDALTVAVVNPYPEPVTLNLQVAGVNAASSGRQWVVAGDDPRAINNVDQPRVAFQESDVDDASQWTTPGYGFAILRLPVG
ncbi:MAG TPA: alpha-L-arabinofuranosidase C-terminal domain-containing protein, partial [Lacipirellulaceae bacterium]|nr:alpha-L-arabinofuranosidase C-terminal domain-containing protein [Lacipirellulaceae bacterium]